MPSHSHDAYVKSTFSKVRNARGELRAVLPSPVRALVDWRTLKVESGSFVDAALRSNLANEHGEGLVQEPVGAFHQRSRDQHIAYDRKCDQRRREERGVPERQSRAE